jgi:hypothetical protein
MRQNASHRLSFSFDQNVQIDLRSPRALEFIAYYLDRIEGHLDRIAGALQSGAPSEHIRLELKSIEAALKLPKE